MRSTVLLWFVLAFVACAGGARPPQPPLAKGGWGTMSHAQRVHYMEDVVTPRMREIFTAFDAQRFSGFNCATCHGAGAADGSFSMPNSALATLPSTPEGFRALVRDKPGWMAFMGQQVRPHMAALLGMPEVDMRHPTPDQFGCRNCHVVPEST